MALERTRRNVAHGVSDGESEEAYQCPDYQTTAQFGVRGSSYFRST